MLVASKCLALVKHSTMPILDVIYHASLSFLSWVVQIYMLKKAEIIERIHMFF
jgi:hypothetical protein